MKVVGDKNGYHYQFMLPINGDEGVQNFKIVTKNNKNKFCLIRGIPK
jgi:hypothetical protein